MKRHWENGEQKERALSKICDNNNNGIGCVANDADTASTSAEHSQQPTKRPKQQQKRQTFCSIERLLRDDKQKRKGDGTEEEEKEGGGEEIEWMKKTRKMKEEREWKTTASNKRKRRDEEEERLGKETGREEKGGESGEGWNTMVPKRMRKEEGERTRRESDREEEKGEEKEEEKSEVWKTVVQKRMKTSEEETQGDGRDGEEEEEEEDDEEGLRRRNWLKPISVPDSGSALDGLNCELENAEIWTQFNRLGTEMIITKSGRRMFPVLRLRFSGTRPGHLYYVFMDVVPVERRHRFRYRYDKSQWQSAGKADKQPFGRLFLHNESPFSGEQLPLQLITFDKAKLTNNEKSNPDPDQLLLNSMHKYRPRVHVLCVSPSDHSAQTPPFPKQFRRVADFEKLSRFPYKTFEFPETKFVAVTAYQNQLVTRKKIELNPFAKGFRDQKGDEEEEKGDKNFFAAEVATTDEWKTKRNGTDKRDEKNCVASVRCPTVLLKRYRTPPPLSTMPCHHPTPIRPVPPSFPLHPYWPPLLPPHLLSGLLFRIGANQQQMRERARSGELQTEKGDE